MAIALGAPYFQRESWAKFVYRGSTYALTHLDERFLEVTDTDGVVRKIAVTFGDHCFTRPRREGDDPTLEFPRSDRGPGYFCIERYAMSLDLPGYLQDAIAGRVWIVSGDNYAAVPVINNAGTRVLYVIVFSLDPVKGLPVNLHLRVKSAYVVDSDDIATFGDIRFTHLVAMRMKRQRPNRNLSRHRRKPRAT